MKDAFQRFRLVAVMAGVIAGVGLLLRVVLWWRFGREAQVGADLLPPLLVAGAVNDLAEALYLLAPLSLFLLLLPDRWARSRAGRFVLYAGSFLALFALIYFSVVEYFFFEEFDARLNLVAVDYLMYPTEVFTDIWESYPVVSVLVSTLWLAAALFLLLRPLIARSLESVARLRQRLVPFAAHALTLLAAIGLYSTETLAHFNNRVANEIAINGLSSFFHAARTNNIDYAAYYVTHASADNLRLLASELHRDGGGELDRLDEGRVDRYFAPSRNGLGRLNVVVVAEESFGAEFSRLHGSQLDWMPNFDALAAQGLWFSNAYASGTRTVRGLEAITTSLPPIPTVSILRRPNNEHVATWGQVMREQGYHSSFLYGGYGYFDNMNYFYSANGFEVIDRNAIAHPRFANIWGVADEDLFDKALGHFDALAGAQQPFFSIIMTTSNHKPFTFRDGVPGVKVKGGGRESGVRYADFALGKFMQDARRHHWFDDTVFVIVADHGARVYGRAEIPLKSYEIPLLVYAPRHLPPRTITTQVTQIDIAPTVLGLLGFGYEAPFFGTDVLAHPEATRVAFFSHNHDVGLLRNGKLVVLGLRKEQQTFTYDRGSDRYTHVANDPQLSALAVAYYQTASELFARHQYDIDEERRAPEVAQAAAQLTNMPIVSVKD